MLRGDGNYVVVYANIDRFKLINETYGNDVGDRILRRIHEIIDNELRWDEVSGRIMADNFGVLMRFHSLPKLDQRLYRISKQLSELTDDNGNCYGIILYFGVYVVKDDEMILVLCLNMPIWRVRRFHCHILFRWESTM